MLCVYMIERTAHVCLKERQQRNAIRLQQTAGQEVKSDSPLFSSLSFFKESVRTNIQHTDQHYTVWVGGN